MRCLVSLGLLLAVIVCPVVSKSYKILVFSPATSKSHLISNGRIADELAKAGHNVILFEPDFLDITEEVPAAFLATRWPLKGLNNIGFKQVLQSFSEHILEPKSLWGDIFDADRYQEEYTDLCEQIVTNKEVMEKLRAEKFDAYFGEQINLCGMGLSHVLGIKQRFWVNSCTQGPEVRDALGLPTPLSFLSIASELSQPATFVERATNLVGYLTKVYVARCGSNALTQMFRRLYGRNFPRVDQLAKDSDIVFVASEELLDLAGPTLPHVVHIGGLGIEDPKKPLDEEFRAEMEKGRKGVVLFSLGTIVNTSGLPSEIMANLVGVVAKFPDYHFLIRVDRYDTVTRQAAKDVPNVFVSHWLPQPALLMHPRLKLFVTHAGYNSLIETARAGVPIVTIPFMFDQPRNSRAVQRLGWGVQRQKEQFIHEPAAIEDAIREVLGNQKYAEKAQRLKKLIRSKPMNASQRLVKTTEWVLHNGGVKELLSDGRDLGVVVYYNLDVIAAFVVAVTLAIILFFKVAAFVIRRLARRKPTVEKRKKH